MNAAFKEIKEGDEYTLKHDKFSRTDFVRYAGAGGDFNPIHHDESFAQAAGLEGVFGMGMLTASMLGRVLTDWFGATSVKKYGIKFKTRLWPEDSVVFKGVITKVYEEGGVKHVDIDLTATNQKDEVLIQADGTCYDWKP